MQLGYYRIQHYIIIKGIRNVFLRCFFVTDFFEDPAEPIPPSSKLFCALQNSSSKLLHCCRNFFITWMVVHVWR